MYDQEPDRHHRRRDRRVPRRPRRRLRRLRGVLRHLGRQPDDRLERLERLSLAATDFDGADLATWGELLPRLSRLDLSFTAVRPRHLEWIARAPGLRPDLTLVIRVRGICWDGLPVLRTLRSRCTVAPTCSYADTEPVWF